MRVRNGGASFNAFVLATRPTWHRYAQYLARRWRGPVGVGLEDLEQEMLLAAWRAIATWDPTRQKPIHEYVVYMAIDKAKKWLHKQRNAKRRSDHEPGRFPVSYAALGLETAADEEWIAPPDDTTADDLMVRREAQRRGFERVERLCRVAPRRMRRALEAIVECGGDLEAAREHLRRQPLVMLDMRCTEAMVADAVSRAALELQAEYFTQPSTPGEA